MADTVAPDTVAPHPRPLSRPLLVAIGAIAFVLAGSTVLLWAHYGTTVFFETIRAGLAGCFG